MTGARVSWTRPLPGGAWHSIHLVRVGGRTLVLRRRVLAGWRQTDPDFTPERELTVLRFLEQSGLPTPRVLAADPAGEEAGTPALLLSRIPGRMPGDWVAGPAALEQLAAVLPRLHALTGPALAELPPFRRYYEPERLGRPRWASDAGVWRELLAAVSGPAPPAPERLIHRDYHEQNTLWRGRRLSGIVDWTQASRGPAAIDVSYMRHTLAAWHDVEAAEAFLQAYRRHSSGGSEHHPYWDLVTVADGGSWKSFPAPGYGGRIEAYVKSVLQRL